jgi:hypothetical protein
MKNLLISFVLLLPFFSLNAQSSVKFKGTDFSIAGYSIMKSTLKEMEEVEYESFIGYNEKNNTFELTVVQTFGEKKDRPANQVELGAKSRREGNDKDILVTSINPANVAKDFLNESSSILEETDMFTKTVYSVYIVIESGKAFKVKMYDRSSPDVFEYEATVGVSVYFTSKEAAKAFFDALQKATNK